MKTINLLLFTVILSCFFVSNSIAGKATLNQGKDNPGSTVTKTKRVKVPDPSKGYDAFGNPKTTDATEVTTSDGTVTTTTDDGRVIKKIRSKSGGGSGGGGGGGGKGRSPGGGKFIGTLE